MIEGIRLKPCPFCGGEAYARFEPGNKGALGYSSVECRKCGAVPYVHRVYYRLNKEDTIKDVVAAWNRRIENE